MAVASRERVYTYFDVSPRTETGKAKLEVVVNGVASTPSRSPWSDFGAA
jgi:hypothetical protein